MFEKKMEEQIVSIVEREVGKKKVKTSLERREAGSWSVKFLHSRIQKAVPSGPHCLCEQAAGSKMEKAHCLLPGLAAFVTQGPLSIPQSWGAPLKWGRIRASHIPEKPECFQDEHLGHSFSPVLCPWVTLSLSGTRSEFLARASVPMQIARPRPEPGPVPLSALDPGPLSLLSGAQISLSLCLSLEFRVSLYLSFPQLLLPVYTLDYGSCSLRYYVYLLAILT